LGTLWPTLATISLREGTREVGPSYMIYPSNRTLRLRNYGSLHSTVDPYSILLWLLHRKEFVLYRSQKRAFTYEKMIERPIFTRQCEQCNNVMIEKLIKLASKRRAVIAYHCANCSRTEYGTVISVHKRPLRECEVDSAVINGADWYQSHL
jgi:hypothetical protein